MRKKIGLIVILFLTISLFPLDTYANKKTEFIDIGSTHRAQAEIYYLVDKGIANGVTATHFSPEREVTRGEAVAFIGRALGVSSSQKETSFSDIPKSHPFSGYIYELVNRGVITWGPNGAFEPNRTLTRGEMAMLISRAFDFDSSSLDAATKSLMDNGISLGVSNGNFGVDLKIKRADFAVFLARSVNASFRVDKEANFNKKMYVNAGTQTLNMRTGPSVDYPSIAKLETGTEVFVAEEKGAWSYIQVGSQRGYVHSNYLQTHYESSGKPSEPTAPGKKPLKDIVVIIDPGHGGKDPGSSGFGFLEKNIALNIGLKMAAYYEKTPIQAKMTRTNDTFLELRDRVNFAKRNNGDIFVAIHTNAHAGSGNGQETFYYRSASRNSNVNQSKALATYVQNRMLEAWRLTDRGVKVGNFHVLRENTMPAVLAEVAFITSKKDMDVMKTEAGRERMAKALFLATLDYYYHFEERSEIRSIYSQFNATPSKKLH